VDAPSARMAAAGAELCSTFALACELQADWMLPSDRAMFDPFVKNLPEYGFAVNNFWNRIGGQTDRIRSVWRSDQRLVDDRDRCSPARGAYGLR
jgi:hypothetical protein